MSERVVLSVKAAGKYRQFSAIHLNFKSGTLLPMMNVVPEEIHYLLSKLVCHCDSGTRSIYVICREDPQGKNDDWSELVDE